jgi:hypothetical protein
MSSEFDRFFNEARYTRREPKYTGFILVSSGVQYWAVCYIFEVSQPQLS